MAAPTIVVITAVLFALAVLAGCTRIAFWPVVLPTGQPDAGVSWLGWHGLLAAGGLGGLAHGVRSLYRYVAAD